jgi:hypothetical protein
MPKIPIPNRAFACRLSAQGIGARVSNLTFAALGGPVYDGILGVLLRLTARKGIIRA